MKKRKNFRGKKKKENKKEPQHVVKRNTCEIINSTQLFPSINKYTICGYEGFLSLRRSQKWIALRIAWYFSPRPGPIAFLLDGPAFTWFSTGNLLFVLFPLYGVVFARKLYREEFNNLVRENNSRFLLDYVVSMRRCKWKFDISVTKCFCVFVNRGKTRVCIGP